MANHAESGTVHGAAPENATQQGSVAPHGDSFGGSTADVQAASGEGTVAQQNVAQLGPFPAFHGRPVSWVAISIMVIGFIVGGLGLMIGSHGPTWPAFWVGAGLSVLGLLVMLATNTFEDWY